MQPYNKETIEIYGKQRKSNSFNKAMWEIENDPDLKLKRSRRDNKSYLEQHTFHKEEDTEEAEKVLEGGEDDEAEQVYEESSKKSTDSPNDDVTAKKSSKKSKARGMANSAKKV